MNNGGSASALRFAALSVLAVALAAPSGAAAVSDTPWPYFQKDLGLEADSFQAWVSNKAKLPEDVTIVPPDASVPAAMAAYSGTYAGWMCHDRNTDVKVAFEKMTATGGQVAFALASSRTLYAFHETMTLDADNQLRFHHQSLWFKAKMRPNGVIDIMYDRDTMGTWCSGVLRKE